MNLMSLVPIVGVILVILLVLVAFSTCYKRVGPNEVLIITGGRLKGPYVQVNEETNSRLKIVKGGASFVWPFIQQAEVQSLDTFNIDVTIDNIMTKTLIPVNVAANAALRVGSSPKLISIAAEKTLGLTTEERDRQLTEIVKGGVREVISELTPEEANQRGAFKEKIKTAITDTFENIGLEITTLQITKLDDENGFFQNLYAKDLAEKEAIANEQRAIAKKKSRLAEAQNNQEAKEKELESQQAIALIQRDTDVKNAQYLATVNAENAKAEQAGVLAKAEQEKAIKEQEVLINQKNLEATVIAQAEADKQTTILKTDADKYRVETGADANASKISKEGQAQAKAQTDIAQAFEQNGKAFLALKVIELLPELTENMAKSMNGIDSLTVFDGAKGVTEASTASLAQTLEVVKQSTGIDVAELVNMKANGLTTITGAVPTKEAEALDSNKH